MDQAIEATVIELIKVAVILEKEVPGGKHPLLNIMIEEKIERLVQERFELLREQITRVLTLPESNIHEGHV